MTDTHPLRSTESPASGDVRPRPYVGRYVPPPRPAPPPVYSIEERIELMIQATRLARCNAHNAMRIGDNAKAAHAFYRAHEYVEMIRKLRALQ